MTDGTNSYDAIIVGGGHNGLVCAAYLARDGLRTLILERRPEPAGMVGTRELLPGVRVPALAHTVGRLRPSVVRDLSLRQHGLSLVQPEARVHAPQRDGRALTLYGNPTRTASELAASGLVSRRDADRFEEADRSLGRLASALAAFLARTPPDLTQPSLADALDGLRAGLAARTRAPSEAGGLLRVLPMAVSDLLEEWFKSDALRALIAGRAVQYTALSPRMPGTAALLVSDMAGNNGGLAGQTVFARGGPGSLGRALAFAAQALGAQIRTSAEVVAVRRQSDCVRGVALASGEEIYAPVVVSGLDPRQTLLDLIEPEVLGPRLSWRAGNIRQDGVTAKVNFALADLPRFAADDAGAADPRLRGRIVFAPDMATLEAAARAGKYGRFAAEPYLEATIPSLVDRSLVDHRPGRRRARHVMSVIVQPAPYRLRDGWPERNSDLLASVVRTLDGYAPGFADLVEASEVVTPADIERDYGISGGHALHAEAGLDQWFAWRPLHGYGRYRLPLEGLYLCGSGAHPGGGVTGAPGQLAAREILADWKRHSGGS